MSSTAERAALTGEAIQDQDYVNRYERASTAALDLSGKSLAATSVGDYELAIILRDAATQVSELAGRIVTEAASPIRSNP